MSVSDPPTGWRAAVRPIAEAGIRVRHLPPYDDAARELVVDGEIAAVKRPPVWVLLLAIPALLLPSGWVWSLGMVSLWSVLTYRARRRRALLSASVAQQTAKLKADRDHEIRLFERDTLEPANRGELLAQLHLMRLWHEARPEAIRSFSARLDRLPGGGRRIVATGLHRDSIPQSTPRVGRGRRTILDKRKAGEIDEDLIELNAAATLSLLFALFGGAARQFIEVIVKINTPEGDIPWVALAGVFGQPELQDIRNVQAPSEAIRSLGGEVGRTRAQRFTPARMPDSLTSAVQNSPPRTDPVPQVDRSSFITGKPRPELSSLQQWEGLGPMRFAEVGTDSGDTSPAVAQKIPAPDPGRTKGLHAPGLKDMTGGFGVVAKRWADYEGNSSAPFVPFQSYYPTYQSMDAAQLSWYFGWRTSFRLAKTPATDLSYVFVHVYELLHIVGVRDLRHAGTELERIWSTYRSVYPKLDKYLVPWIADLYANEGLMDEVTSWYRRALAAGATIPDRELVTDLFWAAGDYAGMPRPVLSTLAGDPKLGTNKFCQQHNQEGWVDRGYREALSVADAAFKSKQGSTLREATIARDGLVPFTREPFSAAIYDWKRHPVTLGKLPNFSESSLAVVTFRGAARHAENILRRERGFKAKLRGVALDAEIAAALDAHFTRFVKITRPRTRVVLDLAKARELAQESADVRSILLAGLAEANGAEIPPPGPDPDQVAAGLLTDLAALQVVVAACSAPAHAVLRALAGSGWEASESDPELKAAAGGALVGPLIDEINAHAVEGIGDVLVVAEDGIYVVQEDFRDEVHWVLHGNLDDFAAETAGSVRPGAEASTNAATDAETTHGFGPIELGALSIIAGGGNVEARLTALGAEHGLSALLLVDRLNELSLASPHGDILVDPGTTPPTLITDGELFVRGLLDRLPALTATS